MMGACRHDGQHIAGLSAAPPWSEPVEVFCCPVSAIRLSSEAHLLKHQRLVQHLARVAGVVCDPAHQPGGVHLLPVVNLPSAAASKHGVAGPACMETARRHASTKLPAHPSESKETQHTQRTQAWMVAKSMAGEEWSAMKSWPSSAAHSVLQSLAHGRTSASRKPLTGFG